MKTLITNNDVVALAFDGAEYVAPQSITAADIAAATARFITPIVGKPLFAAFCEGRYPDLPEEYVAPALAMGVRVTVQPSLNVRLTTAGLTAPSSTTSSPPSVEASAALANSLAKRLRYLCLRLSQHRDEGCEEYAEYDSDKNPLNRCCIYGGVVQVH